MERNVGSIRHAYSIAAVHYETQEVVAKKGRMEQKKVVCLRLVHAQVGIHVVEDKKMAVLSEFMCTYVAQLAFRAKKFFRCTRTKIKLSWVRKERGRTSWQSPNQKVSLFQFWPFLARF